MAEGQTTPYDGQSGHIRPGSFPGGTQRARHQMLGTACREIRKSPEPRSPLLFEDAIPKWFIAQESHDLARWHILESASQNESLEQSASSLLSDATTGRLGKGVLTVLDEATLEINRSHSMGQSVGGWLGDAQVARAFVAPQADSLEGRAQGRFLSPRPLTSRKVFTFATGRADSRQRERMRMEIGMHFPGPGGLEGTRSAPSRQAATSVVPLSALASGLLGPPGPPGTTSASSQLGSLLFPPRVPSDATRVAPRTTKDPSLLQRLKEQLATKAAQISERVLKISADLDKLIERLPASKLAPLKSLKKVVGMLGAAVKAIMGGSFSEVAKLLGKVAKETVDMAGHLPMLKLTKVAAKSVGMAAGAAISGIDAASDMKKAEEASQRHDETAALAWGVAASMNILTASVQSAFSLAAAASEGTALVATPAVDIFCGALAVGAEIVGLALD